MKWFVNDYCEMVVFVMEDVNIVVFVIWVYVLLILLIYLIEGKFYWWGNDDLSVVKLEFKNVVY